MGNRILQWFKRRFKELDHLEEYFPLLFTRWQAAIWGGSVLAVAFGWHFITADWPYPVKLAACIVALFFAGYHVWRTDHLRLQQKIDVTKLLTQRYTFDGRDGILYYFEIINISEALTIHGVRVQLQQIEPEVGDLNWLPVTLQQKHDNQLPHALVFDLNPHEPKNIDLVSAFCGDGFFSVHHIAGKSVNQRVPATERHALKVMVTARDMPRLDKWFDVWMDEAGVLQCGMK